MPTQTPILVISNPVSGDGKGPQFVHQCIIPKIQNYQYEVQETTRAGIAGSLAAEYLQNHPNSAVVFIVSGGDGTIHEVINGIGVAHQPILLVICPQGTANALYSTLFPLSHGQLPTTEYRLKSLHAFLHDHKKPLTITQTRIFNGDNHVTEMVLGAVVASTALHASILDTAEHLRASIPGIERFKVAAAESISNWYNGHVQLHSSPGGHVQIYDPGTEIFQPLEVTKLELDGPFAYFLSTVNVDRLEPAFEISPLYSRLPPGCRDMDLVIIRPLRDPALQSDNHESRSIFVQTLYTALQGAYAHGSHITLRYGNGVPSPEFRDGLCVVEYMRCSQWEWYPDSHDASSHLVCIDGTILMIPENGKAVCEVLPSLQWGGYFVCA